MENAKKWIMETRGRKRIGIAGVYLAGFVGTNAFYNFIDPPAQDDYRRKERHFETAFWWPIEVPLTLLVAVPVCAYQLCATLAGVNNKA